MKNKYSYILGIESSCDDTGVSVLRSDKTILSNIVISQTKEQAPYQGVVPEIAARCHMSALKSATEEALFLAKISFDDVDAIAATAGPGLIGGVIVGTMFAKSLSLALSRPYIAVNHLEGHLLSPRLSSDLEFPYLMLLVSGGHCQFVAALGLGNYRILGQTMDDAVGEAFDKTSKLLGLGYPGGPIIESMAKKGDPHKYNFTVPLQHRAGCDFSFSGLKTAVRDLVKKTENICIEDLCASFQYTVGLAIQDRLVNAIKIFQELSDSKNFAIAGGVAANQYLRSILQNTLSKYGFSFFAPPMNLCTDNGAMIAWAGYEHFKVGELSGLDFCPVPRWSLESKHQTK
ncbi:MAG: Sialoglycoprotease [Pseudomonadota bacterium]|jgi:N6-L-threonylcarbamoyladenine synthase